MVADVTVTPSQNDINEIFSAGAYYTDKIFSSHDVKAKIVRIAFGENVQGSNEVKLRTAVVITEGGLDGLILMLQDVKQKMREGALQTPTLQ